MAPPLSLLLLLVAVVMVDIAVVVVTVAVTVVVVATVAVFVVSGFLLHLEFLQCSERERWTTRLWRTGAKTF